MEFPGSNNFYKVLPKNKKFILSGLREWFDIMLLFLLCPSLSFTMYRKCVCFLAVPKKIKFSFNRFAFLSTRGAVWAWCFDCCDVWDCTQTFSQFLLHAFSFYYFFFSCALWFASLSLWIWRGKATSVKCQTGLILFWQRGKDEGGMAEKQLNRCFLKKKSEGIILLGYSDWCTHFFYWN